MHLPAVFITLLAAVAFAAPSPFIPYSPQNFRPYVKRNETEQAGLFICEHVDWKGKCEHKYVPLGSSPQDCQKLDGTASAIGPDAGFSCYFYKSDNCRDIPDGFLTLVHPGSANLLLTQKGNWNDIIRSFFCFRTPAAAEVEGKGDE